MVDMLRYTTQTVFVGTCEARPGPIPLTRFGLVSGPDNQDNTIQYLAKEAHTQGCILTSGAIYGTEADPLYAGICSNNEESVSWNAQGTHDDSAGYQARFDAETAQ